MRLLVSAIGTLAIALAAPLSADDKKDDKKEPVGPIVLKVISKKDKYVFDGGGKTPKDYKADLEGLAKKQANKERIELPKATPIDLVLQLENTSNESVTVYVNGTSNIYTLDLGGGAGVVTLQNTNPMPLFIRLPKAEMIEPGKNYEIPITSLSDGRRGASRLIFWTGPGEYTLTAKYLLTDQKGGKLGELTSEPVKINVVEK
jgi:hypothetical protein